MNDELLIQLIRDTVMVTFLISAPLLVVAMVVGLLVSIFQVVTSLQDMTLTFVPRMAAVLGVTLFLLPWIIEHLVSFTSRLIGNFNQFAQ